MENLIEQVDLVEVTIEGNVIKNAKLLGMHSRNKRKYPLELMEKTKDKYNNMPVRVNHTPTKLYQDRVGFITNPRVINDSIIGDITLNEKHSLYESILWDAHNRSPLIGMSIRSRGVVKDGIVESCEPESCDIVDDPATVRNFFEQAEQEANQKEQLMEALQAEHQNALKETADLKVKIDILTEQVNILTSELQELKHKKVVNKLPTPVVNNKTNLYEDWLSRIKKEKTWERI